MSLWDTFSSVSCVQLQHCVRSWVSLSPVALIHQRLILCFDLCCLPLASACLKSPSHCERPGPSVSSYSLYEQKRRFHGSNCTLSEALIIAQWTSDRWPPKWNNYTIRCPSRPFCPTLLRTVDINEDGWRVCMSSYCKKMNTLMPQTWMLPSCAQDVIWRRAMSNLAANRVAVQSRRYSSLIGSITRLSSKNENSSTRAYTNAKRTLNINYLWKRVNLSYACGRGTDHYQFFTAHSY